MSKDQHIANIFSAEEEDCLRLEQMTAYQDGELEGHEKNAVERHLINCELCAMTFESLSENSLTDLQAGAQAISEAAWERSAELEKKKRRGAIFWISTAASIAILISVGFFAFKGPSDKDFEDTFSQAMRETSPPLEQSGDHYAMDKPKRNQEPLKSADQPMTIDDKRNNNDGIEEKELDSDFAGSYEEPKDMAYLSSPDEDIDDDLLGAPSEEMLEKNVAMSGKSELSANGPTVSPSPKPTPSPAPMPAKSRPGKDNKAVEGKMYFETSTVTKEVAKPEVLAEVDELEDAAVEESVAERFAMDDAEVSSPIMTKGVKRDRNRDDKQVSGGFFDRKGRAKKSAEKVQLGNSKQKNKSSVQQSVTRNEAEEVASGDVVSVADSITTKSSFDAGLDAYNAGRYSDAASNFRRTTESNSDNLQAHLLAADAYLRISQPQAALYHVERVLAQPGNSYYADAEWYKALALIQIQDGKKAKAQLELVKARNGKYRKQAVKALDELR